MRHDTVGLLKDIHGAAGFIADDTAGATFDSFIQDRIVRQAVERNFEIIGEAMNRLSRRDPDVVARISVPEQIISFRNTLIHGYDAIDYPTVWQAIQSSLPVLRAEVNMLLGELEE